jgi:hypothetical protein
MKKTYAYRVTRNEKPVISGIETADSMDDAAQRLVDRGIVTIVIPPIDYESAAMPEHPRFERDGKRVSLSISASPELLKQKE